MPRDDWAKHRRRDKSRQALASGRFNRTLPKPKPDRPSRRTARPAHLVTIPAHTTLQARRNGASDWFHTSFPHPVTGRIMRQYGSTIYFRYQNLELSCLRP